MAAKPSRWLKSLEGRTAYGPHVADFLASLAGPRPAALTRGTVKVEGVAVPLVRYESLEECRRRLARKETLK